MIIDEIKKNLIEHYEILLSEGALMSVNHISRIQNASEAELFDLAASHRFVRKKKGAGVLELTPRSINNKYCRQRGEKKIVICLNEID